MTVISALQLLNRSALIRCLGVAARFPNLSRLIPSESLRRRIDIAGLEDLKYGGIFSRSSYAPWKGDAAFRQIFDVIRNFSLVDEYRCHELWQLCGQLDALELGDLLEVGVWRGGTGCLMAKRCATNSTSTIFLCDTFSGVVKAGREDSAYVGGEHADTSMEIVTNLIVQLGLSNVKVLQGIFPDATGAEISGRSFRLCHIDVDVYESAAQTFDWVWPRMVNGGIVVFDDYGFYSCGGVTRFVDKMRGQADRLVIYNVNGHAIVVKRS